MVLEDKLEEIFFYLPLMKYSELSSEFKPKFGAGDKLELAHFLADSKTGETVYPLIWLLHPTDEIHSRGHIKVNELVLILAVNTNAAMLNKERIETTFKKILLPLLENVKHAFRFASNLNLKDEVGVVKYSNYSDNLSTGDSNFTIDRWDALRTTWTIDINDKCLKQIQF